MKQAQGAKRVTGNLADAPVRYSFPWLWLVAIAAVWGVNYVIGDAINPYYLEIIMYAGINVVLAVSLNLVIGFAGQFSLGHAGFMAIGAYAAAFMTTSLQTAHPEWFSSPWLAVTLFVAALVVGAVVAALTGYIVGLPTLRLKGDYLAIVTLGFGEIIRVILLNTDAVGGARGLPGIPMLTSFGWVYTIVIITLFVTWHLVNSAFGRSFLAVREDEIAAEAMGVNTTRAKVAAFSIGAFFAGAAGGLFAHQLSYLNPQTFDFNKSFEIVIMVVLGGMGSITGSAIAAVVLTILREALRPLQELTHIDFRMVIYSLILIVMMLTRPNGLFGNKEITAFFGRRRHGKPSGDQDSPETRPKKEARA